jgi:hypothetical protein
LRERKVNVLNATETASDCEHNITKLVGSGSRREDVSLVSLVVFVNIFFARSISWFSIVTPPTGDGAAVLE